MEPSCPLGTTRCIPQAKFHQNPYNKSFIDQACLVKVAGYWPRSFFASLWTSTSSLSITGFVRVLENLESPGILLWHFPGLESPGKRPLVLEYPGNLLNSAKKYEVYGVQ